MPCVLPPLSNANNRQAQIVPHTTTPHHACVPSRPRAFRCAVIGAPCLWFVIRRSRHQRRRFLLGQCQVTHIHTIPHTTAQVPRKCPPTLSVAPLPRSSSTSISTEKHQKEKPSSPLFSPRSAPLGQTNPSTRSPHAHEPQDKQSTRTTSS